jgi:hypothetical protein
MNKYKILGLAFAVFLAITPFVSFGQTTEEVTVTTDKKVYNLGESVEITVVNNSGDSIYVNPYTLSGPVIIQKSVNGIFENIYIYPPVPPLPIYLDPRPVSHNEIFEFTWDQRMVYNMDAPDGVPFVIDNVEPGVYRIRANFGTTMTPPHVSNSVYSEGFTISSPAQTDLQSQIQALLAQITQLQAQLANQESSNSSEGSGVSGYQFTRNLSAGTSGEDVRQLQIKLNSEGFTISQTGSGSSGNETTYFGELTRQAVVKYQVAKGISPAVGFVGPVTRERLNSGNNSVTACTIPIMPGWQHFRSVDLHETGPIPGGVSMGHWNLSFTLGNVIPGVYDGEFSWHRSDYVLTGDYFCNGNTIMLKTNIPPFSNLNAVWVSDTIRLLLQNKEYMQLAPPMEVPSQ